MNTNLKTEKENAWGIFAEGVKESLLPAMLYLLVLVIFTCISPKFTEGFSIRKVIWGNTHMVIAAAGLTFVIAGGWIDISVGYQISLISVEMGWLFRLGGSPLLVILAGFLSGIFCGLINGFLTVNLELNAFSATLASQVVFKGISYTISSGRVYTSFPDSIKAFTKRSLLGLHMDTYIMVAVLLVVMLFFQLTYWGCYIKAIGENEDLVRQSGINVSRIKVFCFIVCGVCCALAALIMVSKSGRATSYNAGGLEISSIAAIYLSRAVQQGKCRRFRPVRLFWGVLMLQTIGMGMQLVGWNQSIQYIVTGTILAISFTRSETFQRIGQRHGRKKHC